MSVDIDFQRDRLGCRARVRGGRRPVGRSVRALPVLLTALLLSGCGTPRIQSVWQAPEATGRAPLESLLVVVVDNSPVLRGGMENSLGLELQRRSVKAAVSHTRYSLKMLREEQERIKGELAQAEVPAVLICRITAEEPVDWGREPEYTPYAGGMMDPSWREGFSLGSGIIYDPGYLDTRDIVHLEVQLRTLDPEQVVWRSIVKVTMHMDEDYVPKMHRFSEKVVRRLAKDGWIR